MGPKPEIPAGRRGPLVCAVRMAAGRVKPPSARAVTEGGTAWRLLGVRVFQTLELRMSRL